MNRRTKEAMSAIDQLLMQLNQATSTRAAFTPVKQNHVTTTTNTRNAESHMRFNHLDENIYHMPCEFTPSKYLQEQLKRVRYAKLMNKSVALKPVDLFDEMDFFNCDWENPKLKFSHIYQELIMV